MLQDAGGVRGDERRLSLFWEALKDFGWLPTVLAFVVAGPSILSIMQLVFVDHKLTDALQWIVDAYNQSMRVLGAVVEPVVAPLVAKLNDYLEVDVEIHPHWRPLFTLFMAFLIGRARAGWKEGEKAAAVRSVLVVSPVMLFCSLLAGTVPQNLGVQQLLVLFGPFLIFAGTARLLQLAFDKNREKKWGLLAMLSIFFICIGLFLFYTLVYKNFVFLMNDRPEYSFLALIGLLLFFGVFALTMGIIEKNRFGIRGGLNFLSGVTVAGFILLADWFIRTVSRGV